MIKKFCSLRLAKMLIKIWSDFFYLLCFCQWKVYQSTCSHCTCLLQTMTSLALKPSYGDGLVLDSFFWGEESWWWWQMRVLLPVGLWTRQEHPTAYLQQPSFGRNLWLGVGVGLASQLHCPASLVAFHWMLCFLQHEKNAWGLGWNSEGLSPVLCQLITAAWQWVVSELLSWISAGWNCS